MRLTQLYVLCPCVLAAVLAVSSCTGSNVPTDPTGEAMFDDFSYSGHDDYYEQHALPSADAFYNPILPGFYPDPAIVSNGEGDYWLACSSFTYFPGVPLFHSRDLINWESAGHILSRESQLVNMLGQHVSGGIFAPGLSYNPKTKTYYMITTNVGAGNFYVKTQDPAGEWSDPIYVPSVLGIDPSIFIDDDGRAYVVNNDDAPDNQPEYDGHRTVRLQELDLKTDQMVGQRRILIDKGCRPEEKPVWCEAPHIYKINGVYFLMTAEGGTGDWHSEVIYRSTNVWGPYVPFKGNPILTQRTLPNNRPDPITCAGHADLIQTVEGDWWAVFLGVRPVEDGYENLGRETFMLPVQWNNQGWPIICSDGEVVSRICGRPAAKRSDHVTFGNFDRYYDFADSTLCDSWLTLRTAGTGLYSLTSHPGYLTLREDTASLSQKGTPALLMHRIHHHQFSCQTTLRYRPGTAADQAGLVLYKDETHHDLLVITRDAQGIQCLQLIEVTPAGQQILSSEPLDCGEVTLRIQSDGRTFSFAYSLNRGNTFTEVPATIQARTLSTREAGGFCGTLIGLYCHGE